MESNPKLIDVSEFDDFFRRGEESVQGVDSLQPIISCDDLDADSEAPAVRTPAQLARRAKAIKFVSMTIVVLTIGTAGAFAREAMRGESARAEQAQLSPAPPPREIERPRVSASGNSDSISAAKPERNPVAPSATLGNVSLAVEQPRASSQPATALVPPDAIPEDHGETGQMIPAKTNSPSTRSSEAQAANPLPHGAAVSKSSGSTPKLVATSASSSAGTVHASSSAASVQRSTSAVATTRPASQNRAVLVRPRIAPAKAAERKSVAAKPDNYRPPTASFADL